MEFLTNVLMNCLIKRTFCIDDMQGCNHVILFSETEPIALVSSLICNANFEFDVIYVFFF